MQGKEGKILTIVISTVYVLLLPWPLTVMLPYMLLSGTELRTAAILASFLLEYALGIVLFLRLLKRQRDTKKASALVFMILQAASFLVYAATSAVYLARVVAAMRG